MIDIKWIRNHPNDLDASLLRRGMDPQSEEIIALDTTLRETQTALQELQERRNAVAKEMGRLKQQGQDATSLQQEGAAIKDQMASLEAKVSGCQQELAGILALIPNPVLDSIPCGSGEEDNQVVRTHLTPTKLEFTPKEHFELGEALGMMDFETAATVAGSRFVFLKGGLAQLERALTQFMLDTHREKFGYTEVSPPLLVKTSAMYGTGQLPKFNEDSFTTTDDRWMIPTAEVPLTNMAAGALMVATDLPQRYVAATPCFRSEAGSAGKDTRGMIRMHQFHKVELVSFVEAREGEAELERMTGAAEEILKQLKLPYRVVDLCDGDIGFQSKRTYDLEVWLPGQQRYREISSCSLCGDFQARRLNARYRPDGGKGKPEYISTLNGSGLATGRTLIAVMENYQNADGSITVPDVLVPYMRGVHTIV